MNPNILVIPDMQVKKGVPMAHINHIGQFIANKRPTHIVNIGDWADMPSLSFYDKGKMSFEGRRYNDDIEASKLAMDILLKPLADLQAKQKRSKVKVYKPKMILTLGNHEDRITRAVENDAILEGVISIEDLEYEKDWEVIPFGEFTTIAGVDFSHYFTSGTMGRPVSSPRALVIQKLNSSVMGHVQNMDINWKYKSNGKRVIGLFVGTAYKHHEAYLKPQGNVHWRGIHMLYNVNDGDFDHHSIPLDYLERRYGV